MACSIERIKRLMLAKRSVFSAIAYVILGVIRTLKINYKKKNEKQILMRNSARFSYWRIGAAAQSLIKLELHEMRPL